MFRGYHGLLATRLRRARARHAGDPGGLVRTLRHDRCGQSRRLPRGHPRRHPPRAAHRSQQRQCDRTRDHVWGYGGLRFCERRVDARRAALRRRRGFGRRGNAHARARGRGDSAGATRARGGVRLGRRFARHRPRRCSRRRTVHSRERCVARAVDRDGRARVRERPRLLRGDRGTRSRANGGSRRWLRDRTVPGSCSALRASRARRCGGGCSITIAAARRSRSRTPCRPAVRSASPAAHPPYHARCPRDRRKFHRRSSDGRRARSHR